MKNKKIIGRREMIKISSVAIAAAPNIIASGETLAPKPKSHRFFTMAEFSLVDELSEMIIPTDEHSPGARTAKVAEFIDKTLAETIDTKLKLKWRNGLTAINSLSKEMGGKSFMRATIEQRTALLDRISVNERSPKEPMEEFFVELKFKVAHAYYSSKIGIKQELEYKGNSYLKEYVGEDVS